MASKIQRRLMLIPVLGLTTVSALAIAGALSGAPAVSPAARAQGVFGDWRVPITTALYKRSDYLFHLGYGYVQADLVASGATEERHELADFATALARARAAEALLWESLELAPADAETWAYLGWARALSGNLAGALEAIATSWSLAPNSLQLAPTRLAFYALLADLDEAGSSSLITDAVKAAARRDVLVLQRYNAPYAELLATQSPALGELTFDAAPLGRAR